VGYQLMAKYLQGQTDTPARAFGLPGEKILQEIRGN
jgi:uncharacterized protein YjaZ